MRNNIAIILIVAVFMPLTVRAYTIQSVNVSSSDTGGISASSGETVSSGPSDVSTEIHTIVTGGNGTGTADVNISTERNGVLQTETRHYDIPQGSSAVIEMATSSWNGAGAASSTFRSSVRIGTVRAFSGAERATTTAAPYASSSVPVTNNVAPLPLRAWLIGASNLLFSLFGHLLRLFPFHAG